MRVYLVTTDEPLYLPRMVRTILSGHARRHVCGIGLLQPQGKGGWRKLVRQFYDLYDTWTFVRVGISFLTRKVVSVLPRRVVPLRFRSVSEAASDFNVPLHRIDNINADRWLAFLRDQKIDLMISLSASQIFKEKILTLPRYGVINVHAAPLPRYRGLLPSFWQLYHGEREGAVTVHWMEKELDSGDIILQRCFPIAPGDTQDDLIRRGKEIGSELVAETIDLIEVHGRAVPTKANDPVEATYFSFPSREEARRFRKMGRRFL